MYVPLTIQLLILYLIAAKKKKKKMLHEVVVQCLLNSITAATLTAIIC